MRTSDEQLREIRERSLRLQAHASARRGATASALGVGACLVLLVLVISTIPAYQLVPAQLAEGSYGSLILSSPLAGLVVICILSFLLGACFMLLCLHLRNLHRK